MSEIRMWFWRYVDASGKQRTTRYRLSEAEARERLGAAAVPVEGSLEVRTPVGSTSAWLWSKGKSEQGSS